MPFPVNYRDNVFPPVDIDWKQLIPLLGPAAAALARYDSILSAIPNASVLLSPLTTQEAVLSSKIEGTQATMGEVLEFEANPRVEGLDDQRKGDIQEILNYRKAVRRAEEMLTGLPLSLRVVKDIHEVLLDGVRGQSNNPGVFRRIPNWIGPAGCTIEQAHFIPISADKLDDAMGRWERYIHEDTPDNLVQVALLHAEFEALHPFLDGNGRLGRMLIPLVLWQGGTIGQPMFYMSAYLESNRDEYYERLREISRNGDWTGWCMFFLRGVKIQADENHRKASDILGLYERLKPVILEKTRSQYAIHALDWIFARPIFRSSNFTANAVIPQATARRLLPILREAGIVQVIQAGAGRRPSTLVFPELLSIAEGKELF